MGKFLSIFLICFFGTFAWAQNSTTAEKSVQIPTKIVFNPVTSIEARTLEPLRIAFQKSPSANINSSFIGNSLSIGVFSRFEVGIIPIYEVSSPGSNFTAKLNFYKGDEATWVFAFSEVRFTSAIYNSSGVLLEQPDFRLTSASLAWNYRPRWIPQFTFSPFATNVCGYLDSADAITFVYSFSCQTEWGLDVQYQIKDNQWVTLGYGHLRDTGNSPYEEMNSGFGAAWSMARPGKFFSRPSVGFYYRPDDQNMMGLISTTFFEK